jgi:hypothetical protein
VTADPYELAFAEAVRALAVRREALESLRSRAGVVLSGAAIASSLFGARAIDDGLGPFAWAAVLAFLALSLALLAVLWPRTEWQPATDPSWIIRAIEAEGQATLPRMRRRLALEMEATYRSNSRLYERLARYFRVAAALLNVEVIGWIFDLASKA